MERIDKNYLFVCQLKEILHDFNLPRISVYTENTIPRDTRLYIKNDWVVRYENGSFIKLHEYAYDWPEVNFTKNLIINSSVYDEYTHSYFGDYLRFLRDYHKVNLMGMYNCFFNQKPSRIYHIFKDGADSTFKIDTDDDNYNYYAVPIKFDQTYTISIDSNMPYELVCILYNNKFISDTPLELIKKSYKKIPGSKFKKPFVYHTSFDCVDKYWKKEKDFRLFLKLPKSIDSSIVILEGDYRDQADVFDFELIPEFIYSEVKFITDSEGNIEKIIKDGKEVDKTIPGYPEVYGSKNSFFQYNNHNSYPLSSRLIEYIVGCVISPLDGIDRNIERVQSSYFISQYKNYGIWNKKLRDKIYRFLLNDDVNNKSNLVIEYNSEGDSEGTIHYRKFSDRYTDLTYYVDKDVESLLGLNAYE